MTDLTEYSNCKGCAKGISMCKRCPCVGTPEEMMAIIKKFPHKLSVSVLALSGFSYVIAPKFNNEKSRCVFLNSQDNCELHDLGLKPMEGRLSCCKIESTGGTHLQAYVANTWPMELQNRLKLSRYPMLEFFKFMIEQENQSIKASKP